MDDIKAMINIGGKTFDPFVVKSIFELYVNIKKTYMFVFELNFDGQGLIFINVDLYIKKKSLLRESIDILKIK